MRTLAIREARALLTKLVEILDKEGEVIVTRRGRPIYRILPVKSSRAVPSHRALRQTMPRLSPSEVLVRADRDER
ncbi:MAG: type II toxin-antitoxin system prevent-host-death family antitoxin [Proteobacteria bacterium]|nr:type II toxin-antitoxin system prevent-host-death family antitoxin [Pseudomonadota bacterium]